MTRLRVPQATTELLIPIFEREYKELSENCSTLERKAQVTAAVCGGLLSVVATLLLQPNDLMVGIIRLMTALVAIMIGVAAIYALGGITVEWKTIPAPGDEMRARTRRLVTRYPSITEDTLRRNILHHTLRSWEDACEDLLRTNNRKAHQLKCSHLLLQFAGFAIALTFGMSFIVTLG